jgi:protein MpaA
MVIPCVNPDGLALATRKNAGQVDINRNWPTENWTNSPQTDPYHGGAWPASEPETQAILNVMTTLRPKAVISFHTPYAEVNTDGPADKIAPLAQAMASAYSYPVTKSIGYPTPGSFGSWAGVERGYPVLTVELAEKGCEATLLGQSRQALLNVLACLSAV